MPRLHRRNPHERRWAGTGLALLLAALPFVSVGCFLNPTKAVDTNQPPVVSAVASPDSGEVPLTVSFQGAVSDPDGQVASLRWDFGDGGTSNQLMTEHVYMAEGDFDASLIVTDNKGATTTAKVKVHGRGKANRKPSAAIVATPMSGVAPLEVSFTANATDPDGTVDAYSWTFGDGGTSTLQDPTHTFTMPGNYAVRVTVTDDKGASSFDQVRISVTSTPNLPPTASAQATPTSGTAPLTVNFTGSGTDPDGTVASYDWTFGDGGTSNMQNPSHTYTSAGNFTARLTVTDDQGATAMATVAITVDGPMNQPPTASATGMPTSGTAPLMVNFTGSGNDPDGSIMSWAWTFGDGGTSTMQSPSHTYNTAGNFTARLTVTDNGGATASATVAIAVTTATNTAPVANAGPDQLNKDPGTTVSLSGAASSDPDGSIASYAWTQIAGPAVTLTGANTASPSFQSAAGTTASYTFRLTVTDNGSPAKSATDDVVVSTRVTYANMVGALLLARGRQPNGELLGCTSSGCHTGTNSRAPLSTYTDVYSVRSMIRSRIQPNGSMAMFLASGEAAVITAWIDAGAPEKN